MIYFLLHNFVHFLSQFLFAFCVVVFVGKGSVVIRLVYSIESLMSFVDSVFVVSNKNSFLEIMKSGELVFGF